METEIRGESVCALDVVAGSMVFPFEQSRFILQAAAVEFNVAKVPSRLLMVYKMTALFSLIEV